MAERSPLRRALCAGLLLTSAQVPSVHAYPRLPNFIRDLSFSIPSSAAHIEERAPCAEHSSSTLTGDVALETSAEAVRIAVEIADGQVQVPAYTTYTAEIPLTSDGVVHTDTTTLTAQITYYTTKACAGYTTLTSTSASLSSASASTTKDATASTTAKSSDTLTTSRTTSQTTSTVFVTTTVTDTAAAGVYATAWSNSTIALTTLTDSAVQTATSTAAAETSGTVITKLETSGEPTSAIVTTYDTATTSLSLVSTATISAQTTATAMSVTDIFVAIETDAPPKQVTRVSTHPVERLGVANQTHKLETNKFYANFFLGDQSDTSFTHPYSVAWAKGSGGAGSYGLSVNHVERSQVAYGPGDPALFFINPVGIQSIILSASELGNTTNLTTDSLEGFSVNVNLAPSAGASPAITFPLVQGMGFVTGVYNNSQPMLQSSVAFLELTYAGLITSNHTYKYLVRLGDQTQWMFYVTPSKAGYVGNTFTITNSSYTITGAANFTGSIQVAKLPNADISCETVYDASAGAYATAVNISGSVTHVTGTYSLKWSKAGNTNQTLLMFALPHHMDTLNNTSAVTDVILETTTKGNGTAVLADSWTLVESNLPIDMSFAPWSPTLGSVDTVSDAAVELINTAGYYELSENMAAQTDLNSMYYSGKALAKFATIIYTLNDIAKNTSLATTGLVTLKECFATFVNNSQIYPLYYESVWGGVVSSATYETNDSGEDFGNTYYNDHHFHYGYFVYAGAVIGYLDPEWLEEGTNKAFVNMLVRDYGNSINDDAYFPFSRSFDWYHGHSWAKGLFASGDGKDQESSSEDTMSLFAMKMWGRTINDTAMEARGNLQLAMQARSLQNYYLYESNNTVQPAKFIGNKVAGILFENKVHHTTYFGANQEYIEGIHMLPLMPSSTLTRTKTFVTEEWNQYFGANGSDPATNVTGGWQSVLYANLAIIDPGTSYDFFANPSFDYSCLDGGASRTWYAAYAAALGGSSAPYTAGQKVRRAVELVDVPLVLPGRERSEVLAKVERRKVVASGGVSSSEHRVVTAQAMGRASGK